MSDDDPKNGASPDAPPPDVDEARLRVLTPAAPLPSPCGILLSPEDAARRRKLDCRFYDKCLDIAIVERWDSFTCKKCKAYDPKSRLEKEREAKGLLAIFDPDLE